jgi:hypothetical protein
MDCTYHTNRFGMPLLNIVGVSGMNTTIHVGQAFLAGEKFSDYQWALSCLHEMLSQNNIPPPLVFLVDTYLAVQNALESEFPLVPVLLCLWHIMKDVQAYARRHSFPK